MTPLTQLLLVATISWSIWRSFRRHLAKNPLEVIRGPPCNTWLAGHFDQLWDTKHGWKFHQAISDEYGGVIRLANPFGDQSLFIFDTKALNHVLVKELDTFQEGEGFTLGFNLALGSGLLGTAGEMHKRQRKMMNPVFSAAHMKTMVPIFYDVMEKLRDTFVKKVANGPQELDITHWMARGALELIGQSGLGYSFDTLTDEDEGHPYCNAVKGFVPATTPFMTFRFYLLPLIHKLNLPPRFLRWLVDNVPMKSVHRVRDIVDVLWGTAVEVVESKKQAIREGDDSIARQVGKGKDIISTLIKANSEADEADRLPDEEVIGQVSTIAFAATDTTSGALARILHVLCGRVDIQDRMRAEIRAAKKEHGQRLDYDMLMNLSLMDAVCKETLRLYPPVSIVLRETIADTVIPFGKPVVCVDGTEITELHVPKGTTILPSIRSANRNPDVWGPTANEWRPERWLDGLPDSVIDAKVPGAFSHLMTFIGGGRACIGFRFSLLEIKVALSVLLDSFEFAAPKDKEIFWQMSPLVTPTVVNGGNKIELPMILRKAASEGEEVRTNC